MQTARSAVHSKVLESPPYRVDAFAAEDVM
jgi:hypothetical protein